MKKYLFFIISNFSLFFVKAQEFYGVKVDGQQSSVVSQLKEKGFTVTEQVKPNLTEMTGSIAGTQYTLYVVGTVTSKTVWKINVLTHKVDNWTSLKELYNDYVAKFTAKYGEPEKNYMFFAKPYDEGDGYEMTGVKMDKCDYLAYWKNPDVQVSISTSCKVSLSYQNDANALLNDKEKAALEKGVF